MSGASNPRSQARMNGQALTEFLVIAVALVPLFLLLPMIGKYQDLAHATQMASRYAAFDATSFGGVNGYNPWKPPSQLASELQRRFYGNAGAPIKTGDVAGNFDAHRNVFWRDPYGRPLIQDFNDVTVSFGNNSGTQVGGFSASQDGRPFDQVPFANADTIGLAAAGVYTANVAVALANLPQGIRSVAPFDSLDLSISRHTSLLFDPWSSPTTVKTEQRVGTLAPLNGALGALSPVLDVAIRILDMDEVSTPKFGDLREWRDVVPTDRLVPLP